MNGLPGYWAVAETGQGGGLPNALHGPFYSEADAIETATALSADAQSAGRRDRFEVAALDVTDDEFGSAS